MIRVYQEQDDDCFRAAVASIMEIPLIRVPDLHGVKDWRAEFVVWALHHGYRCEFSNGARPYPGDYVAIGESWSSPLRTHAVVYRNGVLFHDPHPDNKGFKRCIYSIRLTPRSS